MDDMDDECERRKEGGTVIGKKKICGLKFADDAALVSDTVERLQGMLKGMKRYAYNNKMEVSTTKTKVMVCRNGRRLRIEEKW